MKNAQIAFRDTAGIVTQTVLKNIPTASAPDLTKLLALATTLHGYTNAGIAMYSLLDWTETPRTSAITPVGVNSLKAAVQVRYAVGTSLFTSLLWMPNPNPGGFEVVEGEGTRMTQAYLDLLTASLTTLAGFDVTAVEGKVLTRNYSGKAAKSDNSIRFEDEKRKIGYMGIPRALVPSAAALDTFAGQLETDLLSQSKITASYYVTVQEAQPDPTTGIGLPAADATNVLFTPVETRAMVNLSYISGGHRKFEKMQVPAVKFANCVVGGGKYKLLRATGNGIATALTTFYGSGNRLLTYRTAKISGVNLDPQ